MKKRRLKLSAIISRAAILILIQLLCCQLTNAQSLVTGTVKDENGATMPGVTVQVKGKSTYKTTELNGKFHN